MTVADKLRVEHRRAPRAKGDSGRRMRRAHDPSGLRARRQRFGRHPQQQAGDARGLRSQCQFAAGDEIELPRLAPDLQHHDAKRIAGQRVGGCPQRGVDIRRAHGHEKARIEAEFGQPAHRQRAGFNLGKVLPHPHHGPPGRHPPDQPGDEPGRGGAVPSLGEHLMHRAHGEAALQRRIGLGMAERDPVRPVGIAMRLDALDAAAQGRKRVRACAAHAPLPLGIWAVTGSGVNPLPA
jgi:hypothetical protein